jgi:hypothetical protein
VSHMKRTNTHKILKCDLPSIYCISIYLTRSLNYRETVPRKVRQFSGYVKSDGDVQERRKCVSILIHKGRCIGKANGLVVGRGRCAGKAKVRGIMQMYTSVDQQLGHYVIT